MGLGSYQLVWLQREACTGLRCQGKPRVQEAVEKSVYSSYRAAPAPAWPARPSGSSRLFWCSRSPHRSPASTLAVSQRSPAPTLAVSQSMLGPLGCVFLVFSFGNLIWNPVVLACKRTSVLPVRQEARGRSQGKSTKAKYRVGESPASWLKFKVSLQKRSLALLWSVGAKLKLCLFLIFFFN